MKEGKTMASFLKPIPDGYHTNNAYLTLQDGPAAIEFYQKAFGMEVGFRLDSPPGKSKS
jgi:PhnB protein